jgi:uncharacterized membrane protein required for colicin V production
MLNRILAVVVGIITGFLIVTFGDLIVHQFIIVPDDLNVLDKKSMADFVGHIPTIFLITMVGYWLLSSFVGAMIASIINRNGWRNTSLIVGAILMSGAVSNLIIIPHPSWMLVVSAIGYLPFALLGGKITSMLIKPKN